jgi:hypothetical protein
MKGAFIFGISITVFGIIISLLTNTWHVTFVISATTGGIAIVIASSIKRFSQIKEIRTKLQNKSNPNVESLSTDEYWIKAFTVFALPNIVVALITYFMLYR